jgi:DNA-binding response OmpR family regulator
MAEVLIVEDDARVSRMLQAAIEHAGHAIFAAARNASQAVEALAARRPDVAVLDLRLGGGELSYPVAEELKRQGVPFVFMTGFAAQAIDPVFAPSIVLRKPVRPVELLAVLRTLTMR